MSRIGSFLARSGRYGINRVLPESIRTASGETLRGGYREATKTMAPRRIGMDELRHGYMGRYADGGRARFAEMVRGQKLRAEDLDAIAAGHARSFLTFLVISGIFMAGAVMFMSLWSGALAGLGAAILVLFALGSLVVALQADFSGYQIRMQRFCGFSEYVRKGFFRS